MLAGEIERLETVAGAHGLVAAGLDQVAKELHVELIVLDDHHLLRHRLPVPAATRLRPAVPMRSNKGTKPGANATTR